MSAPKDVSLFVEHLAALHSLAAKPSASRCTDVLAALLPVLRGVDPDTLKQQQRDTEAALLKVLLTPPGVGPMQRGLLADALATVFSRGTPNTVFSRLTDLCAQLGDAPKGAPAPADVRLGGLAAVTALCAALGPLLSGSAPRLLTAVVPRQLASPEPALRAAALALAAAAARTAATLPPAASEAAHKAAKLGAADKAPAVRRAAFDALAALSPSALFGTERDKVPKPDAWADAAALAAAGLRDPDRTVRAAAAEALGAAAAAALLPPAAVAAAIAPPPPGARSDSAKLRLAKALEGALDATLAGPLVKAKTRAARVAAAQAWAAAVRRLAARGAPEPALVAHAVAALQLLARLPPHAKGDEEGAPAHTAACCVHVVGAVARARGEPLRRALLTALSELVAAPAQAVLLLLAALRGVAAVVALCGELTGAEAAALAAPLQAATLAAGPAHLVLTEAVGAQLALARANPASGAAAARLALAELGAADPRSPAAPQGAPDPATARLVGQATLLAALCGGDALSPEQLVEAEGGALRLVDARSGALKRAAWALLAALLAGPGGGGVAERHGATLAQLWRIRFAKEEARAVWGGGEAGGLTVSLTH